MPKENFQLPVEPGTCDLYVRGDDVFKTINHDKGTKTWRKVRNYPLEIAVHDYMAFHHTGPQISFDALRTFIRSRVVVYPDALRTIGLNKTYRAQQAEVVREVSDEKAAIRRDEMKSYLNRMGRITLRDLEDLESTYAQAD